MPRELGSRVGRLTLAVIAAGILLSAGLAIAAQLAYDDNEERLLHQRSQEAASVLQTAIPGVEAPLAKIGLLASQLIDSDPETVRRAVEEQLAADPAFVAISVRAQDEPDLVISVGDRKLDLTAEEVSRRFAAAVGGDQPSLGVVDLLDGDDPRLGYVHVTRGPVDVLVYAERPTPPDRRSTVDRGEAFDELDFALYLDDGAESTLIFASTEDGRVQGRTSVQYIPFGDQTLEFVVSPAEQLSGRLLATLPWMVAVGGLLSTMVGAALVQGLQRRRHEAETLTAQVEELYGREHEIAATLQQSLLPRSLPDVPGAEIAVRYVAGAQGAEVGGDWYDAIDLDDDRLVLIVGDVAGHGVEAAAVMAAMRYGTHTIAAQDVAPEEILGGINRLDTIRGDFVTMVCALLDVRAGTLTISRAGHPPPLVIDGDCTRFLDGPVGPPIGFLDTALYPTTTEILRPGATLLLFTDGLYERKGEDIDAGLQRLRSVAAAHRGPLRSLIDHVYESLVDGRPRDDVAMLAVRIEGEGSP